METKRTATASSTIEERRQYVENSLGSLRMEGLDIDASTREIADRYIAGKISGDEMTRAILKLR